jgi:O-antigen ligase/tetratricopeptide (TPR) repeat protein
MKHHLSKYLDAAVTFLLYATVGLSPLLFFNQTTEFFEIPKLIFLIGATLLLIGLWLFSCILKGKVSLSRTPLDIPLALLLVAVLVSAFFSTTRLTAIYGDFPKINESIIAWAVYVLLYFVTATQLRSLKNIRGMLTVLYVSGAIVAVVTLLSFFKIYLPFDFAKAPNFTPTGSTFSTIAMMLLLLPLPLVSLLNSEKRYMPVAAAVALSILFGVVVILTGSLPFYILLVAIIAVVFLISRPQQIKRNFGFFMIPVLSILLAFFLASFPLPGALGSIHNLENNFPKEIQLPFPTSWKVSASSFRDAPFFGTGPASYVFNFTSYKPVEYNILPFWSFSFDAAHDEFLTFLGTLGIFGFAMLVILSLVILAAARKTLMNQNYEGLEGEDSPVLVIGLALSGIVAVALLALHSITLVSALVTIFVLAAFMMAQRPVREKLLELSMGIKATTSENRQIDLFPVILFILFILLAVPFLFRVSTAVMADYNHRQALNQATKNGTLAYQYLQKAESLNPYIDLYRVDMAQTNFALANALAAKNGPTKDNPKGSLSDNDKKTIQTLLSQAINEARVSVTLSPRSATNWEVLGSIYRNIAGVAQNALTFSLDAYSKAIQRDPVNPALRVTVGGIYYAAKNYTLATRYFSDAANLKPDYANAYYNLAIALRDGNDLTNATLVAQQLVNLLGTNKNSPDYKVATTLLADLKGKLETAQKEAQQQQQTNQGEQQLQSAGEKTSALQNSGLQNVTTLNNPPKVTPVPAVKSNPNANIPQVVTPTPTKK